MPRRGSLRYRIVAAYGALALAVCAFFALVVFFAVREIEKHPLEGQLESVAQWQLQLRSQGVQAPMPPGFSFYSGSDIPVDLTQLPPGFSTVTRGGLALLAMRGVSEERPYVVVDEIGDFRKIQRDILVALALGISSSIALAVLLGRLTAGRVIAPVTALAQAVEDDALDVGAPLLALNDEIGVLARSFAARTEQLRQFLMRERLFAGDVSHELRTPLTIILGAAEVLASRVADRPEMAAAVERIQRTALDTADRVGALLLLSRSPEALDTPRLALRPVVEREIERCRPLLVGKPVELVFEPHQDVIVFARSELAAMAIGNLLRNACNYTDHGAIVVGLTNSALVIEDTGSGIPEAMRTHVFERFVRGDDVQSGSGLGLAIVKRICEHLDWRVDLEDGEHGGSRFTLAFSAGRAVASPAEAA